MRHLADNSKIRCDRLNKSERQDLTFLQNCKCSPVTGVYAYI